MASAERRSGRGDGARARGGRGRGSRTRGGVPNAFSRHHSSDRDIMDGLSSTPIQQLSRPRTVQGNAIKIKDLKYLGSYNWVDTEKPTIIVPGSPREWTERTTPYTVPADEGIHFVDQDGHRMQGSRFLPLFRAVDIITEENGAYIDWSGVDFVTDRNGLRKLLRWISPSSGSRDFRIDTQLAGGHTVLFNRWEKRTKERLSGTYGFSFEHESTVPARGCERSSMAAHHRVVKYDFDGFTMVVTFEVDACLPTVAPASSTDVDKLADHLSGLQLPSTQSTHSPNQSRNPASIPDVRILRAGSQVSQDSLVELTTASHPKWREAFPQLFISQTPHHFQGVHEGDQFVRIVKKKLGDPEMVKAEEDAQPRFRQLRKALQDIQELVVAHGDRGRISLVYRNGEIEVFERTSQSSCLPESVLERFA